MTQGVTTARRSPKEDREHRLRTYLIAMAFRTVSFPLAVWALLSGWIVVGVFFALAATILPQIAVMLANAVDRRTAPDDSMLSPIRALPEPDNMSHATHPADGRDARL